jgi:hypothetical protein
MTLDGVRFVFQNVPGSEAPAELAFYLPDLKAYCGAEMMTQTMHNLYTLRGAKVRDALRWSDYIDDAIQRFPTPRSSSPATTGRCGPRRGAGLHGPPARHLPLHRTTRPCACSMPA